MIFREKNWASNTFKVDIHEWLFYSIEWETNTNIFITIISFFKLITNKLNDISWSEKLSVYQLQIINKID